MCYVVINALSRVAPCCLLLANEIASSNQIADQGASYGAAWCCEVELDTEIAVVLTPTKWAIAETASAQCLSWPPRVDTAIASTAGRVGVQELGGCVIPEALEELIVYEVACLRGKRRSKLNCCWARVVVVQTEDNRASESRMLPPAGATR